MRILVIGAGAVGGYFGGRLAQANRDVTFLVRARRADGIKSSGLQIVSPHGDLTLPPKTITADQIAGPYDVVLLCVKSYALSGAIQDFAPAVGPDTMILPVLNGMRHIDVLVARFGEHPVLGGVCMVSTEIDQDGRIRQLSEIQKLIYGERDGRSTPRLQQLDETLRGAGFDAAISTDIVNDMWQKWVHLASLGTITCLLRGSIGEVASIPGGADLSRAALRECSSIAATCGHPAPGAFLERLGASFTSQDSPLTSSMYRDLKRGEAVEADTILGDLLEHGRKHGLTTPLLEAAFVSLSIYERQRDRAKTASN